MSRIAIFEGSGWDAVPLREEPADSLTRLFEQSEDYFELVQGRPPGPAEVQSAFTSLPEGKAYEDKFAFVLLDENNDLFGQLELIRDYPDVGEWWIGILLLAPARRRGGLALTSIARVWNGSEARVVRLCSSRLWKRTLTPFGSGHVSATRR